MGIDTNEGYLGTPESDIEPDEVEVRNYADVRGVRDKYNRMRYRDMKTGRFVSEKGLAEKTKSQLL